MGYQFKADCDENWKRLNAAIVAQIGSAVCDEVSRTNTDGKDYVTLCFSGYGEVVNVPIEQLELVG